MFRRADKGERAGKGERLEQALEGTLAPQDPETRRLMAAAGSLAPSFARDPARIEQTRQSVMAAYLRTLNPEPARDEAGSDDGLEQVDLHRAEVELPGGGRVVISDIEEITPERLNETTAAMAEILARRARDRQS
ncbi:hypothetical protein HHL19_35220 [Streptomyces sp. R302]|uniref:hypothetical protein n=1 Tax=unclassified Streptomyces TaxID=2593676 RepID=UPI00145D12F7|nr:MULTISPECIES: hypothetical protein [unclassified Streptomyces]NML55206.1 hypothetical protein [Streptomyces sp. R301]NML83764.1 hypothetical protein [Streptomyces sp. R302]